MNNAYETGRSVGSKSYGRKKNLIKNSKDKNGPALEKATKDYTETRKCFYSLEEFTTEYLNYRKEYVDKIKTLEVETPSTENLRMFYHLYKEAFSKGGYFEVCAYLKWGEICHDLGRSESPEELKEIYSDKLFHFELKNSRLSEDGKIHLNHNITYNIEEIDPKFCECIKEIYEDDLKNYKGENFYRDVVYKFPDAVLLKKFTSFLNLDDKLFSFAEIEKNHGKEKIDIVIQNSKMSKKKYEDIIPEQIRLYDVNISEYIDYQTTKKLKQFNEDDSDNILFAVNVDVGEWKEILDELLKKLPAELSPCSEWDILSYSRQHVKGVSLPQLYLKVKGCWTGVHEENLRLRAININHGPNDCDWYTIDTIFAPQFRRVVKETMNIDIHKEEGLWFCDLEFCLAKKIPVKKFVQKPGDIVVLGHGCLHWVCSRGRTVNTAWNFASKEKRQLESIYSRWMINKEILFRTVIPIQNLLLDYLIHECNLLDEETLGQAQNMIETFFKSEFDVIKSFSFETQENLELQPYEYDIFICSECRHEIFNYWALCKSCGVKAGKKIKPMFLCIFCFRDHKCQKKENIKYYYKFDESNFKRCLEAINKKKIFDEFCEKSRYVGTTRCQCPNDMEIEVLSKVDMSERVLDEVESFPSPKEDYGSKKFTWKSSCKKKSSAKKRNRPGKLSGIKSELKAEDSTLSLPKPARIEIEVEDIVKILKNEHYEPNEPNKGAQAKLKKTSSVIHKMKEENAELALNNLEKSEFEKKKSEKEEKKKSVIEKSEVSNDINSTNNVKAEKKIAKKVSKIKTNSSPEKESMPKSKRVREGEERKPANNKNLTIKTLIKNNRKNNESHESADEEESVQGNSDISLLAINDFFRKKILSGKKGTQIVISVTENGEEEDFSFPIKKHKKIENLDIKSIFPAGQNPQVSSLACKVESHTNEKNDKEVQDLEKKIQKLIFFAKISSNIPKFQNSFWISTTKELLQKIDVVKSNKNLEEGYKTLVETLKNNKGNYSWIFTEGMVIEI